MKKLIAIMLLASVSGCIKKAETPPVLPAQQPLTQSQCIEILTNKVSSVTLRSNSQTHTLPIRWLPVEAAQHCSRPLDMYLKDIRIGAFVDWSGFKNYDAFAEHYSEFRSKIADALEQASLPKTRILIAGEAEYPYEEMKLQNKAIDSDKK